MQKNDKHSKDATWVSPVAALTQPFVFSDEKSVDSSIFIEGLISANNQASKTAKEMSINKRQGFRIGELNLMIPYEDGSELSDMPRVYPIPNAPHWFSGFCELHGVLIPVFNLQHYFKVSNTTHDQSAEHIANKKQMLLVLQHHHNATGIVIDGLLERLEYHKDQLQENAIAPAEIINSISASYLIDNQLWFDLDSLAFLDHLEQSVANS